MDAPGRRYDGFLVGYHEVAGFGGFAHEMEYAVLFGHIEIKINFASAGMRMRWHGVPNAAGIEHGKSHYQLAAFYTIEVNVFVNRALVGRGQFAERYRGG